MNQVMDGGMGGRGGGDELVTCGLVAVNSSVIDVFASSQALLDQFREH